MCPEAPISLHLRDRVQPRLKSPALLYLSIISKQVGRHTSNLAARQQFRGPPGRRCQCLHSQADPGCPGLQAYPTAKLKGRFHPRMEFGDAVFEGAEGGFLEQAALETAVAQSGGVEIFGGEGAAV